MSKQIKNYHKDKSSLVDSIIWLPLLIMWVVCYKLIESVYTKLLFGYWPFSLHNFVLCIGLSLFFALMALFFRHMRYIIFFEYRDYNYGTMWRGYIQKIKRLFIPMAYLTLGMAIIPKRGILFFLALILWLWIPSRISSRFLTLSQYRKLILEVTDP